MGKKLTSQEIGERQHRAYQRVHHVLELEQQGGLIAETAFFTRKQFFDGWLELGEDKKNLLVMGDPNSAEVREIANELAGVEIDDYQTQRQRLIEDTLAKRKEARRKMGL